MDETDLTPGRPDTSSDVVRLYLADMSRVPLLTRQEEVTLAKRIEHGPLELHPPRVSLAK